MFRPFVIKEAQRLSTTGVTRDDLIQEGLIAVALAFRSWRPDGGAGFLSWIRQPVRFAMLRLVREQRRGGGTFRGGPQGGANVSQVSLLSMDETRHGFHGVKKNPANGTRRFCEPDLSPSLHDLLGHFDEPRDSLALDRLPELLANLTTRERKVIRLRFQKSLTHAQVGERLGISRELARQLEARALQRLREMLLKEEPQA